MFKAKSIFISLCAVLAVLCFAFTADAAKGGGGCKDRDNDGYFQKEGCGSEVDCDDSDATVNPSAAEVCDGIDNNCDGTVDEGCGGCTDNDGDVYGDGTGCLGPDCDDADSSINPGASEVCDDNVDNNCDGTVDEGCGGCEPTTNKEKGCDCFDNADNDCDGSTDSLDRDCKRQTCDTCFDNDSDGWYTCGGDCDDSNPAINPSAPEVCNGIDDNCDELLPIEEQDVDWDGVSICEGDCDDNNPNKSPNNTEEPFGSPICTDGIDNDCDNLIDAVDPGCEIPCIDNDGDGYGANGNPSCLFPFEIDCNDNDPAINQGAMEVPYDGIDQDCNGSDLTDADRDGFDADIIGGTDCNDSNALIYPGAIEGPYGDLTCCDTVDNNCDGTIDEIDPGCLDGGGEAAKCEYKIIDLGTLSGSWSKAFGINNQGQIVGLTGTTNGDRAFLYENGVMTNLGTLGGTYSVAYDVNNYDQVVGYSFTATSGATAYIYENGSMTDLGVGGSFAFGINDSGQIVGQTFSNDHAFLYVNGVTTDLGTLGGTISRGYEINNVGQIAGVSRDVNDFNRAFLYENGVMSDLGTLGGDYSVAFDINDNGQIVGYSPNSSGSTRAFLYESGVMNDIGTLTGAGISYAHAINNSGKIVGWSSSFNSYTRAFVYDNGSMAELGTLGGRHSWAEDINDTGEIVGWAYMNDNVYHAVMWTPDADNDGYYSDEDCDDTDPNINPEALEGPVGDPTCADGLDNDCDGNSDSFDSDCVLPNCDIDGDGYCGSCSDGTCISGDCDDTDPLVNPGGDITICDGKDTNCDGLLDFPDDIDADGDGVPLCAGDCDDNNPNRAPDLIEGPFGDPTCADGFDNDCDLLIDQNDPDCSSPADAPHDIITDCTLCHDAGTYLLNAPIPNSKCEQCHTPGGSLKGSYPAAPDVMTHYSNIYIDPTTGVLVDIDCVECHNPMRYQTNLAHIRSEIRGWPVVFGPPVFPDFTVSYDSICSVCHTQTNYYRRDGSGQSHNDGSVCTACHTHQQGFVTTGPEIDIPHDYITDCTVCHDPGTYVLNADIPNVKCLACHDGSSATQVVTHSNTFIDPATGVPVDIQCVECHNPMRAQLNLKHIRGTIRGATVVFTSLTGPNSFADGDTIYDGICEVCHTQTTYHRNDGTGGPHNAGMNCMGCHTHDSPIGF